MRRASCATLRAARAARRGGLLGGASSLLCGASLFSSLHRRCVRGGGGAGSGSVLPPHSTASGGPQRRWQSSGFGGDSFVTEDSTALDDELASALEREQRMPGAATDREHLGGGPDDGSADTRAEKPDLSSDSTLVRLERLDRPPGRFDLLTSSLVYRWETTAALGRKVTGPMREWSSELKYRTGVHIEVEATHPERLQLSVEDGGYASADDVELTLYLFGSERGVFNCHKLMEAAVVQDPSYVRLGVFRRIPDGAPGDVEWLLLRRINRELRPPDIPPISLKLPGKWTLLYEQFKEAAIRTLWEETGITVEPANVFPTGRLLQDSPLFYWRVPVRYFVAEVPYDVEVLGPQTAHHSYLHHWDSRLLRQSPDPIDRVWAQQANPETGCAWMRVPVIDELQRPLRGENYMAVRYTPPPYSNLASVLGFESGEDDSSASGWLGTETASSASLSNGTPSEPAATSSSTAEEPAATATATAVAGAGASESTAASPSDNAPDSSEAASTKPTERSE